MDGNGTPSTNGTWYLADTPVAITADQRFKAGRSIFQARFV
jgi:hypothetical protein